MIDAVLGIALVLLSLSYVILYLLWRLSRLEDKVDRLDKILGRHLSHDPMYEHIPSSWPRSGGESIKTLLILALTIPAAGCTVTGRAYVEHERGPDRAGACVEWRTQ